MLGFFSKHVRTLAGRTSEMISLSKKIFGEEMAKFAEEFFQEPIFDSSPYLTVAVLDQNLSGKDWNKFRLEFSINGLAVDGTKKILIDDIKDELEISIIKKVCFMKLNTFSENYGFQCTYKEATYQVLKGELQ